MSLVLHLTILQLCFMASTSRPAGRELIDRALAEEEAKEYRLAVMDAQKPKDLAMLAKMEDEIDKIEASWKRARADSAKKRDKDAARDKREDALKACGAARKAILSLRKGMCLSAQSAAHFKYGQEKKAVAASTLAIAAFFSAMQEWPSDKGSGTTAHSTISNASFMQFWPTLDSAVGLHLTELFGWAKQDAWLSATAWVDVDRSVRSFLLARKPDIWSKHKKTLDLIMKSLPSSADQDVPKLQDSIKYWTEYAAPKPSKPREPTF